MQLHVMKNVKYLKIIDHATGYSMVKKLETNELCISLKILCALRAFV